MKTDQELNDILELYRLLDDGRKAVQEGKARPLAAVMESVRQELSDSLKH